MYTRSKEFTKSNATDLTRFVETIGISSDYANSTLMKYLDESEDLEQYTITKYEGRVDLISEDIYGDTKYSWILMYINRMNIDEFIRGKVINYIPIAYLEDIFDKV